VRSHPAGQRVTDIDLEGLTNNSRAVSPRSGLLHRSLVCGRGGLLTEPALTTGGRFDRQHGNPRRRRDSAAGAEDPPTMTMRQEC